MFQNEKFEKRVRQCNLLKMGKFEKNLNSIPLIIIFWIGKNWPSGCSLAGWLPGWLRSCKHVDTCTYKLWSL